jgi:hypothetical protein
MAHDVFISHSSQDKIMADTVCAILERNNIRCWVAPRDIAPGADWMESIMEALNECRAVVLIFSKSANESRQIKREINRAIDKGLPIIPFRIENVMPTGAMEYSISTAHWLDAFNPPLEEHILYLAECLNAHLGRTARSQAKDPGGSIPVKTEPPPLPAQASATAPGAPLLPEDLPEQIVKPVVDLFGRLFDNR